MRTILALLLTVMMLVGCGGTDQPTPQAVSASVVPPTAVAKPSLTDVDYWSSKLSLLDGKQADAHYKDITQGIINGCKDANIEQLISREMETKQLAASQGVRLDYADMTQYVVIWMRQISTDQCLPGLDAMLKERTKK